MARMKKQKPGGRGRGAKGASGASKSGSAAAPRSVDEYLAGAAQPARGVLTEMRETIRSVVPVEATEIISYRIPAFRHGKVLVWYAAFAGHCSLFPTAAVIEDFKDDLSGYTISKGTIQFPIGEPLPVALIKRIVKARAAAAARGNRKVKMEKRRPEKSQLGDET